MARTADTRTIRNYPANTAPSRPIPAPPGTRSARDSTAASAAATRFFDPKTKFDSGTGWPEFLCARGAGGRRRTCRSLLVHRRTEIHCARLDGASRPRFNDGPRPTGPALTGHERPRPSISSRTKNDHIRLAKATLPSRSAGDCDPCAPASRSATLTPGCVPRTGAKCLTTQPLCRPPDPHASRSGERPYRQRDGAAGRPARDPPTPPPPAAPTPTTPACGMRGRIKGG